MDRWKHRVAVVTGASSGIGASIAENLLKNGLIVVGLARRVDKMENISQSLSETEQSRFHTFYCDISDVKNVKNVFTTICSKLGGVDIIINNAGCVFNGLLATMDVNEIQAIINTNLMGPIYCTQEAARSMIERNFDGHVIMMNSILGHNVISLGGSVLNAYPLSKFAITAATEVWRREFTTMSRKIKVTVSIEEVYSSWTFFYFI